MIFYYCKYFLLCVRIYIGYIYKIYLLEFYIKKFVKAFNQKKIIKIGKKEEKINPEEVKKQVYDELCNISNSIMNNIIQL